jgi:hypothetical protein
VESKELKNISIPGNFLFEDTKSLSKKKEIASKEIIMSDFCCVTLVELDVLDLGLDQEKRFNYTQVCRIAQILGYEFCSTEEAYAYALQFPVERDYSFYFFGMDITPHDGFIVVGNNSEKHALFLYGQETQLFLSAQCVQYEYKFIFKKMATEGSKK